MDAVIINGIIVAVFGTILALLTDTKTKKRTQPRS